MNHRTTDLPPDSAVRTAATAAPTGLDAGCLQQALHDLRGPLNNATILLEIVRTLAANDPDLARAKLAQSTQELHRLARMIDQLSVASDGVTQAAVPLDLAKVLGAAAAARPAATRITIEPGAGDPFTDASPVHAPEALVERTLRLVFERCAAALPDGGSIHLDRTEHGAAVRLTFSARGPRVERPSITRPRLTDGSRAVDDWFTCWALVRRMRGELHVDHGNDVGIRIAIDLPRPASPRS